MRKERRNVSEIRASRNRTLAAAAYQTNPGLAEVLHTPKAANNKNIFNLLSKSMGKGGATKRVGGGHVAVPPKRDGADASPRRVGQSPRAQRVVGVAGGTASPRLEARHRA